MKIKYEEAIGIWKIISWDSKVINTEIKIDYKNLDNNVISNTKVWDLNKSYSVLYDSVFKDNLASEHEFNNYILYLKKDESNDNSIMIEIYHVDNRNRSGSFPYNYDEYYSDSNLGYISDEDFWIGKLEFLSKNTLKITETNEDTHIFSDSGNEYATHEIICERIEDEDLVKLIKSIRVEVEEKINNELTSFYAIDSHGNETQLTFKEAVDTLISLKGKRRKRKKWWEFWK